MVDYSVGTGTAGTLIIRDNGSTVEFILYCTNGSTNVGDLVWGGTINNTGLGDNHTSWPAGTGAKSLGTWNITFSQTVEFNMQATGTSGLGGPTALQAYISRATLPPAPNWNAPPIDQITASSMRIRWNSAGDGGSGLLYNQLQRADDAGFSVNVATENIYGWEKVWGGLASNKTYHYRVRAVNSLGAGAWTSGRSASTISVPGAPAVPVLSSKTTQTIQVTVADPAGAGSILERQTQISTSSTFTTVLNSTTAYPSPSWNAATPLTRGTQYYVRFRVRNAVGWGAYSPALAVKTNVDLPSAPTGYGLREIASTTAYTDDISVPDDGGGTLNNVRVQVNTVMSDVGGIFETSGGYWDAFVHGMTPGTAYYARIAVSNSGDGGGFGPYGAWVPFTTEADVPGPPASITVTAVLTTTATVSWTAPTSLNGSTLTGYTVWVSSDPGFASGVSVYTTGVVLSEAVTGLQPGTDYFAQVRAESDNGPGSQTIASPFTTAGVPPVAEPVWMRLAGEWQGGEMKVKVATEASSYPDSMIPDSSTAYPDYSDGAWKAGVLWQRIAGVWRQGV